MLKAGLEGLVEDVPAKSRGVEGPFQSKPFYGSIISHNTQNNVVFT